MSKASETIHEGPPRILLSIPIVRDGGSNAQSISSFRVILVKMHRPNGGGEPPARRAMANKAPETLESVPRHEPPRNPLSVDLFGFTEAASNAGVAGAFPAVLASDCSSAT